jgi:hypothetical protein
MSGLQFCQEVQRLHPNLPIFLLTSQTNPDLLIAAYNLGVKGYSVKGTPLNTLVRGLKQVATGREYWQIEQNIQTITPRKKPQSWLEVQRRVGLEQIDGNLKKVKNTLNNSHLPLLDWLFWTGRRRELLVARWLIKQLLPVEYVVIDNSQTPMSGIVSDTTTPVLPASTGAIIPSPEKNLVTNDIYAKTLTKIQSGVDNLTNGPIEIDILRQKPKKDLLYLVFNQVLRAVEELKFTDANEQDVINNIDGIIKDIWQLCSFEFITKNYADIFNDKIKLLDILLRESVFIGEDLLDKIPFKLEIFQYLISQETETEPEKVKIRFEVLWHNLIIDIANGVVLTILNNLLDEEIVQPDIYQEKIVSSRDIAKFRNRLTWKYRRVKYIEEPQNIFEDQYKVYYFDEGGIVKTFIKASRKNELKQLKGFRWWVTILIELRDAIAPGIAAVIDWLGKTLVYLLTEVIGKAIGLIGKGFVQGIGNSVQETRYRRRNSREK